MGQYQADFSAESIGNLGTTPPAGWTKRWDAGGPSNHMGFEIVANANGPGGKALRITQAGNTRSLLSLDAVDADANRDILQIAILAEWNQSGTPNLNGPSVAYRATGADLTENGFVSQQLNDAGNENLRHYSYLGGGSAGLAPALKTIGDGLYWHRTTINGSNVRTLEVIDPSDLSVVASHVYQDNAITGVGWVGLFTFTAGAVYDVLDVLVATNGDTVSLYTVGGGDVTAPVLSSPTGAATGSTTASGGVATDEGNGTLYAVCTTSATQPGIAQIKAGQDHTGAAAPYATSQAVGATGAQAVAATGLTASTAYYWHFLQTDAAANDSSIVSSSQFTTTAGGATTPGVSLTLYDGATPQANRSTIVALWWDSPTPTGTPDFETAIEDTDGSGIIVIDLSGTTALSVGQDGFLLLYDPDGTDHRDSPVFASRWTVQDIG